ncbi:MAG: hypothetical protein FWH22_06395 [Fibromonadales bacterium]|nr:hypothetical protein [Fibromonadales bacterium]
MKTKYFFSAAACAAMAFIFFACSSDDSGGAAGGSNFADLPKQVYIVETGHDGNNMIVLKKEEYKGNGDIELRFGDEDEYDVIPVGKIQNGQVSLNLPIDSKWLKKWEPCDDTDCQSTLSVVPKNLSALGSVNSFDITRPNESDCNMRSYLIKSDENVRVYLIYFSESGKITGTEIYEDRTANYDMNFSKGWNPLVVRDSDDFYMTTDLPDGTLEWWIACDDD